MTECECCGKEFYADDVTEFYEINRHKTHFGTSYVDQVVVYCSVECFGEALQRGFIDDEELGRVCDELDELKEEVDL